MTAMRVVFFARCALPWCVVAATSSTVAWAQFTPGRIVVSQYGDGTTSGTVPITLREFTTSGNPTGFSVTLPTVNSGSHYAAVATLSSVGGYLKRSVDGRFLTIVGSGTEAAATRTIARVDASGTVDTTTNYTSGNTVYSAITTDGTSIWFSAATGNNTNAGIRYVTLGNRTTGVNLATGVNGSSPNAQNQYPAPLNARVIGIFDGQLYGSANTPIANSLGFTRGVFNVGSGLPTSGDQYSSMIISGGTATAPGNSPWEFFFAGDSALYVANAEPSAPFNGGLQKWIRTGGSWSLAWTANAAGATGMRGLTGIVTGSSVQLFGITAVSTGSAANSLVALVDTLAGTSAPSFTTLATADTNYVFRGVAIAPVPEPATVGIGLSGLAALAVARRIRRRRAA